MKKRLIVLLICLVVSAAMCLLVSLQPHSSGPEDTEGSPTLPSRPDQTHTHTQIPVPNHTVRLYICDREDPVVYEALAQRYTALTGIDCEILTGDLDALLDGEGAPTIFCLHSQEAFQQWQSFFYDLTDAAVLDKLYSDSFALKVEGRPVALAMDVTGYGIVYNAALLARAGYTRSDMTDLETFRQVLEAITASQKALGFAAFSTPSFSNTDFIALLVGSSQNPDHIRATLDMILANDAAGDALDRFVEEKTVFFPIGAWDYETFSQIGFHNLDMLPFYSVDGAAIPCICGHYWAVNGYANPEDIALTLDFLQWVVTAGEDGIAPVDSLGIVSPFEDAAYGADVFTRLLLRKYIATEPVTISWSIAHGMTKKELNNLSIILEVYIANPSDDTWKAVVKLLP